MRYAKVDYVLLRPTARVPEFMTPGSSGADLKFCPENGQPKKLKAGETGLFETGLAIGLAGGIDAQVVGRSSFSARGLHCATGTIDSDYRGEVRVVLMNLTGQDVEIDPGMRVGQLVFRERVEVNLVEAKWLPETQRGTGGFGSTGTR